MKKKEYMEFEYSVIFRVKVDAKNILSESLGTQNLAVFCNGMWYLQITDYSQGVIWNSSKILKKL